MFRIRHLLPDARFGWIVALLTISLIAPRGVRAVEEIPKEMQGIQVDDKLGASIPLDLEFVNSKGERKPLRDYFDAAGERPVMMTLVYYSCPVLCNVLLNELTKTMAQMKFTPGQEYEFITLSFDPQETAELAASKKENYLNALGRPDAAAGWHWMVGEQENIVKLTSAMGFHYEYDTEQQMYAHPPVIYILTPEGKISRMLTQLTIEPKDLKLALIEASDGKIGTVFDHFVLSCYHYNPDTGSYQLAMNAMRAGGVLTMLFIGGVIGGTIWNERRKMNKEAQRPIDADPNMKSGGAEGHAR